MNEREEDGALVCRLQILVIEGGSLGGGKFAGWPSDLSISRSPKCY